MFVSPRVFKSFAVVLVLFVPLLSVVFAQEDKDEDASSSSSLLLTNYNALREEGQGFYLHESSYLFETPGGAKGSAVLVLWVCDLEFSSEDATTNTYGYVGRGVRYFLGSTLEDIIAQGAQIATPADNGVAFSISAVLVPTLGIFEGQIHDTHDDWVIRYWDDGSSTYPLLGWEGHDEGDASPNSETSALSSFGTYAKITTEEAAKYLGMDVADMTPETCSTEYEAAWNATHVPDPIDTSVTTLEENVAQLQADNKELLSRIAAIEGSLTANGSGSGDDGKATETSSLSPVTAWYKHDTTDIVVKSIMTVAIIVGLVSVDFN